MVQHPATGVRTTHTRKVRQDMERPSSNRAVWIGVGIVLLVALAASSWGGGMLGGRGMGPFGLGGSGARPFGGPGFLGASGLGFWGMGLLVRLLFFGLIAFLAVRLFRGRGYRRYSDRSYTAESPEDILRRRFAAGDLTREQYEDMRRTLNPTT